jgi:membrane protease YdiL (CAAX protease family)
MFSHGFLSMLGAVGYILYVLIGVYVYSSLIRQISARSASPDITARQFGFPDAIVAILLSGLFLFTIALSLTGGREVANPRTHDLLTAASFTLGLLVFLVAFLRLRGFNLGALAGLTKLGFGRVLSTGTILLFAGYPIIILADALTRRLLGEGLSKQEIIQLFNASQTLPQRIIIIIMAVALAPVAEEFMFRFFLYGVLKRYFGRVVGLLVNASFFAAVHTHLPSFAPLFVLGCCFTIAYEWSGSILVPMTMHALFNAFTLTVLAFPQSLPQ